MVSQRASTQLADSSLFSAGVLVFGSTLALSIGGYVFNAIAGRALGVDAYGSLYALIALYTMAIAPVVLVSPVIAKYAAELQAVGDAAHLRGLFAYIVRALSLLGLGLVVVAVALSAPIGAFLRVPGWEIVIVGVMTGVAFLSAAVRAFAQGVHAYGLYSASVVGEGVVRVGAITAFTLFGLTAALGAWAFFAGLATGVVVVVAGLWVHYRNVLGASVSLEWSRLARTMGGAASIAIAMSFVGFADVVIVKHFFSDADSGLYSAASLCAKIILYFVSFIPAVLIPQTAHRHTSGQSTRLGLWASVGFVVVAAFAAIVGYVIFGSEILRLVVGPGFSAAAPLLPLYGIAMALLSLTNTMASYALATNRLHFTMPLLLATVLTVASIIVAHPTLMFVTQELMAGTALMMLTTAIPLALQAKRV